MERSRRQYLGAIAGSVPLVAAGCTSLGSSRPGLDLAANNYRDEPVELGIELVRPDFAERSKASVYEENVEIPAQTDGPGEWRRSDVAKARSYRVELTLPPERTTHYHYVPDCTEEDASYDPLVEFVLNDVPGVVFYQTECGDDIASSP